MSDEQKTAEDETEIAQKITPSEKGLVEVNKAEKKHEDAKKAIETAKGSKLTEKVKEVVSDFCINTPQFLGSCTNLKNFVADIVVGTTISKEYCEEMLKELKEAESKLKKAKVEAADQALVEISSQQVQLMKRTWEIIKDSCEIIGDSKQKIAKIDKDVTEMEDLAKKLGKLIDAYNGEYANDETKKKVIMSKIKSMYETLRINYVNARSEINELNLKIGGEIVKLDLVDSQHTDMMIQNATLSLLSIVQACTGKHSPSAAIQNFSMGAKNFTDSLNAKSKISQTKKEFQQLKDQLKALENRLILVKEIKTKAENFLKEVANLEIQPE